MEHETYREWMDREVEGELPAELAARLADHLAGCEACRTEHLRAAALQRALDGARIPVRRGFHEAVMAALPEPAWRAEPASRPPWRFAVALFLVLGGLSTLLFVTAGSGAAPSSPLAGAGAAVVEMLGAALVTGAGLLAASWSGLGMAVGEMFSTSPGTLLAFAVLLLFLSLLLIGLLRRPRAVGERADGDPGDAPR